MARMGQQRSDVLMKSMWRRLVMQDEKETTKFTIVERYAAESSQQYDCSLGR